MAITSKTCLLSGTDASSNSKSSQLSETWVYVFDTVQINSLEAIRSTGLYTGTQHDDDEFLTLTSVSASPISGSEWTIELEYNTQGTDENNSEEPEDYKPVIEFGEWTFQRVIEFDKESGDAIVNSAGDKFDPPPVEDISYPIVSVTIRESSAKLSNMEIVGSINNTALHS